MELNKIVESALMKMQGENKIQEIVSKNLESTIESAVRDIFGQWSDFSKDIKAHLQKELKVELGSITIPEHSQFILGQVKSLIEQHIHEDSVNQIKDEIDKFFKPLEKDEWKVSEIIEKFKEDVYDPEDEDTYEKDISFHANSEEMSITGSVYQDIYFDERPDTQKYLCKYQIRFNPEVWHMDIDGVDVDKFSSIPRYGFDNFMYKLFTSKAKIILDEEYVDTYIHETE
jgi:hypothetical protein